MSSEDVLARTDAVQFADGHTPMALEQPAAELPPDPKIPSSLRELEGQPVKRRRRTAVEIEADKLAREFAREAAKQDRARVREELKQQRAAERVQLKIDAQRAKVAEAEDGTVELPAVVLRDGTVRHVNDTDAWFALSLYLDDMCLDCETSGYPLGHQLYELRTVQLGGEECAVVFDAADSAQMEIASLALTLAKKLRAHSATADVIPCVVAGLIGWEDAWGKMQDSVLNAKLTDPKMSGSDADALKQLASDLLREYAVSPQAEKAKNELFHAMGAIAKPMLTTPPEKNGWYSVNKNSVVMTRYAGSDVLDLAAVLRVLPPIPVDESVMLREREFQAACATITLIGFKLDPEHIKAKIAEAEEAKADAQHNVAVLSGHKITNPKSPDVIKILPDIFPGLVMPLNRKTKRPSADSGSLEKVARSENTELKYLCKQILRYRQQDTKLGLLLRPFEALCEHGDGRGRTTIYTIEASTGRTSSRRFNAQQLSRRGGVRACIIAGEMNLELVNGQWEVAGV